MFDLTKNDINVEDLVKMKEIDYSKQEHWDPHSKNYVASERDELYMR